MSLVRYNGVTIPYAFHTAFRQEVLYDDQGRTDWYCTRFDIEFQAVLNADYANLIYPALQGATDNPAVFMKAVRTALLQPRRQLQITFNGVNLIPDPPPGNNGTVDAQNGPQPQHCTITQMTNKTFLLTYRTIAHYWENNVVDAQGNPIVQNNVGNNVLYNRWSESVNIDEAGWSKRIREGKFVIRSDNRQAFIADQLRSQMAVVGVPQGFIRESADYTVSPDGLAIQYRIIDREVFKNPPVPAFKATGTYTESSPLAGALRYLEVQLRLEGPKNVPQDRLIAMAVAITMSKIGRNVEILNPHKPSEAYPLHHAVRVGMYENWVEVLTRVQTPITQDRTAGISANYQGMTYTPGSDAVVAGGLTSPTPAYTDRATAGLLLQAAAYYDPSILATMISKTTGQFNTLALEVGQAGVNQE